MLSDDIDWNYEEGRELEDASQLQINARFLTSFATST